MQDNRIYDSRTEILFGEHVEVLQRDKQNFCIVKSSKCASNANNKIRNKVLEVLGLFTNKFYSKGAIKIGQCTYKLFYKLLM